LILPPVILNCTTRARDMAFPKPANMPVWGAVVLLVVLIVLFNVVPAALAIPYTAALRTAVKTLPAAPPPLAFGIVWPILYTLLAVAVSLMIAYPQPTVAPAMAWVACGLVVAQLGVNWAWTPVFAQGQRSTAAIMTVVMLMVTLAAMMLTATSQPIAAALLAPYAAWLVFALVLSAQASIPV
jgi:benzodiazapine receptor